MRCLGYCHTSLCWLQKMILPIVTALLINVLQPCTSYRSELECGRHEILNPCPKYEDHEMMLTCQEYIEDRIIISKKEKISLLDEENGCIPRCECKRGYLRRVDGRCVRKDDCCDDPNEVLVDCPNPCPPTCDNLNTQDIPCDKECKRRGCTCRTNYVRDSNDKCVLKSECKIECGTNEHYTTCLSRIKKRKHICKPGCECDAGYQRNEYGKCVEEELECLSNEILNPCAGSCSLDDSCDTLVGDIEVARCLPKFHSNQCRPKCECIPGLVRKDGVCVAPEKCCNSKNEIIVNCPAPSDKTCPGAIISEKCRRKACRCIRGYVRNKKGRCIPKRLCPLKCKQNENLERCLQYCHADPSCDYILEGIKKKCPPQIKRWTCIQGCVCKPDFVRINGSCVPSDECCKGSNEILVDCSHPHDESCEGSHYLKKNQLCFLNKCVCDKDYVRNSNGKCIKKNLCPLKCGVDEVSNICPIYNSSEPTCMSLFSIDPKSSETPPKDYKCTPRCECKQDMVRVNKTCVPISQCCKDPNEVVVDCPSPCDHTCDSNISFNCNPCYIKGCRCKDNYVRNCNGNCIPLNECSKTECKDPNETFESCGSCDGSCENPHPECPKICNKGCFCKQGYVRNVEKKCVKVEECTVHQVQIEGTTQKPIQQNP